jgi:hypothetical protein
MMAIEVVAPPTHGAMDQFADVVGVPVEKLGPVEDLTRKVVDIASRCVDHEIEAGLLGWYGAHEVIAPDTHGVVARVRPTNPTASGTGPLVPSERGLRSMAERLRVPGTWLVDLIVKDNEWRAASNLLNNLIDSAHAKGQHYLVRQIDNKIRAVLSDRYRRIDNFDLIGPFIRGIESWLPDRVDVDYAHVDENGMSVAVTFPEAIHVEPGEVAGDTFQGGFLLRNSEVGLGATECVPRIWRVACSNGLIVEDKKFRKVHLGANLTDGARDVLQQAIYESIQHCLDAMPAIVEAMHSRRAEPEENVPARLDALAKHHNLGDDGRNKLFMAFTQEPDYSRYGVIQAVTAAARDESDLKAKENLESLGGVLVQMPRTDYERVYVTT